MLSCSPSLLEFAHRQPAGSANSHSRRQTRKIAAFRAGRTTVKAGLYSGCSDPRSKLAQGTTNHLYSVSAITNLAGQVVERYSYNAYGVRTVKNPANVVIPKSVVGNDRGFTSYKLDGETALYAVRARMYSGKLGRFVSRDNLAEVEFLDAAIRQGVYLAAFNLKKRLAFNYPDGLSLYAAYMVPGKLDPNGNKCCNGATYDPDKQCCQNGGVVDKVETPITKRWICPAETGCDPPSIQWDFTLPEITGFTSASQIINCKTTASVLYNQASKNGKCVNELQVTLAIIFNDCGTPGKHGPYQVRCCDAP